MEATRIAIRSAKAKGARLQRQVADMLLAAIPQVAEQDIKGTAMGRTGPDLELSREAQDLFPFAVECKNTQSFSFWSCMNQALRHAHNERHGILPLLVFKRNHSEVYCALEKPVLASLASAMDPAGTDILAAAMAAQQRPGCGPIAAALQAALDSASQRKPPSDAHAGPAPVLLQQLHGFGCVADSFNVWAHLEKLRVPCKKHGLLPYIELAKKTAKPTQHPHLKANQPFSLLPFPAFLEMYITARDRGWRFDPVTGAMGTAATASSSSGSSTPAVEGPAGIEVHGVEPATSAGSPASPVTAQPQQQHSPEPSSAPAVGATMRGPQRQAAGIRSSSTLAVGPEAQQGGAGGAGLDSRDLGSEQAFEGTPFTTCTVRVRGGHQAQRLLASVSIQC